MGTPAPRFVPLRKSDDGAELGIVFGYVLVCKSAGEAYVDLHDHHITEDAMLGAAVEFMEKGKGMKVMHDGGVVGDVLFMWPQTTEVAKAFDLPAETTGLMVGVKPSTPEVLAKFKSGELAGFSISGTGWIDEE
jgi:hypothetical protein